MASKFTRAQGPLSPPAPGSHAPLIVIGLALSAFIIALFYVFLCDADLRVRTFTLPTTHQFFQPTPRPLSATALLTVPVTKYEEVKSFRTTEGENQCAICLNSFEDDELVRLIPNCSHIFHKLCIDKWFQLNIICPVCRADLSQPVTEVPVLRDSTASSNDELVPELAQEVVDTIIVVDQGAVEDLMELNWRWNSTGHDGVAKVDPYTLMLPESMWKKVMALHSRGASLNYVLVDGKTSRTDKFRRFWSDGQYSGRLRSFTRSFSRQWGGEEGSKRDYEEELQEQEQPIRTVSYAGRLYRRERSGLSAREPVEVERLDFAV